MRKTLIFFFRYTVLFSLEKNLIKLIALINAVLANVEIDLFSCSLTILTSWLE